MGSRPGERNEEGARLAADDFAAAKERLGLPPKIATAAGDSCLR